MTSKTLSPLKSLLRALGLRRKTRQEKVQEELKKTMTAAAWYIDTVCGSPTTEMEQRICQEELEALLLHLRKIKNRADARAIHAARELQDQLAARARGPR